MLRLWEETLRATVGKAGVGILSVGLQKRVACAYQGCYAKPQYENSRDAINHNEGAGVQPRMEPRGHESQCRPPKEAACEDPSDHG